MEHNITEKTKSFIKLTGLRIRDRKTHIYRHCPTCGQTFRLPKRKGTHTALCPICKKEFTVNVR